MDRLVSSFLELRRRTRRSFPLAAAISLAVVVAIQAAYPFGPVLFGIFAGLLAIVIGLRARKRTRAVDHNAWRDTELGVLLVVMAFSTVLHLEGTCSGRFYPLVYLAIAVTSAFAHPRASLAVIFLSLAFEAGLRLIIDGVIDVEQAAPHVAFALIFGLLNIVSLRMEVARLRKASRIELEEESQRIRDKARQYRLLRAPTSAGATTPERNGDGNLDHHARDRERLLRSGVEEIQMSVLLSLKLLRQCLAGHTVMLLWLDTAGTQLVISELVTAEVELSEGPFSVNDGILGAVITQQRPVVVSGIKPSYVLPYYTDVCPVQAVCAVPVFEHGALRGVLAVDRKSGASFNEAECALVEQSAHFIARAIENERVFVQLERTKVEQGKLYRAAESLGAAMSAQQVVDAGVDSASEIAAVDFAAFTAYTPPPEPLPGMPEGRGVHTIHAVRGDGVDDLLGSAFKENTSLVSMALRNRHPLPYRSEYDPRNQVVFAAGIEPPAMPSLVVLPLVVQDQPLGTLVLGSNAQNAFGGSARALLEVLASHMAVSLSNARMVCKLEEQARTDGLTGLLNKRAMLDTADEKLRAARRFGRQLSVLVTDIDLFKNVNDNHGHDVGDVVIKELGRIHTRVKRATDHVARFGGEEFVVICEETDSEGAELLAERIRQEFSRTTFHTRGEPIQCTCSIGIATFPQAGESWNELFKAADTALYVSKRGGRDRVTVYDRSMLAA
jgi:diguanylate cyclase (GGDEF)-like protein